MAGSIRTADDATALDVKISIWDTEVTMRADGSEIGHWPTPSVSINPIDAFSFEFIAEGDRLIFTPNNPDELREHPLVSGAKSKRKKRAKKSKQPEPASQLRWDEETVEEKNRRASRTKSSGNDSKPSRKERKEAAKDTKRAAARLRASQAPVVEYDAKPAKPSRRERRAAAAAAEPVVAQAAVVEEFDTPIAQPKREKRPRREKPERNGSSSGFADMRHRAWIKTIDLARQYDVFGLDRVPVAEEQRDDPSHNHTWDHRVAPASGPGSFICTICGAFKRGG